MISALKILAFAAWYIKSSSSLKFLQIYQSHQIVVFIEKQNIFAAATY